MYNSQDEYKFKRQKKHFFSELNDISFNKTKRVINSDNDMDNMDSNASNHKKRIIKFETLGGLKNLFNKTPKSEKYRGIRIVKRCHSNDLNLFNKNYSKFELPKVRKHFVQKDNINDIYFNKNKSKDYLKMNKGKVCNKYKKFINVNPLNWRINVY